MPNARSRVVEGTCWPCKQRRVKCDMNTPSCRKCILLGSDCTYEKVLLRWRSSSSEGYLPKNTILKIPAHGGYDHLSVHERRAVDYFKGRVWGLLSTSAYSCPAPISLALQYRPVLLAICSLADAHRTLQDERFENSNWQVKRLNCLSSVREQLEQVTKGSTLLSSVLVAVLLLYLLDGFIDCSQPSVSTTKHQAGARAIIEQMGGYPSVMQQRRPEIDLLLAEFASTDLTNALLHGYKPYFGSEVWPRLEESAVWWEKQNCGDRSLAFVFSAMTDLALYRESIRKGEASLSFDKVKEFEQKLSLSHETIKPSDLFADHNATTSSTKTNLEMHAHVLYRAFLHSALIFLYRGICGLPTQHILVQQQTRSCLDCINSMGGESKAQNCSIFPLYVAGAHVQNPEDQKLVLARLDEIYRVIRFEAVVSTRSALKELWNSERQNGTWEDMFHNISHSVLVL